MTFFIIGSILLWVAAGTFIYLQSREITRLTGRLSDWMGRALLAEENLKYSREQVDRLNRYIDESKAPARTFVVARNFQEYRYYCLHILHVSPNDKSVYCINTNEDNFVLRGIRARPQDVCILYGEYYQGRHWDRTRDLLKSCGFTHEHQEIVHG